MIKMCVCVCVFRRFSAAHVLQERRNLFIGTGQHITDLESGKQHEHLENIFVCFHR